MQALSFRLGAGALVALAGAWLLAAPPRPPAPLRPAPQRAARSPAARGEPGGGLPVLGHLVTRDHRVTLLRGSRGTVYSVSSRDGRLLHRNLSAPELQARLPGLYDLLKDAIARPSPASRAVLDARVLPEAAGRTR